MAAPWTQILRKVDDYRWEIPTSHKPGMNVPGLIFADEPMLRQIAEEQALEQVANVATLPGIRGHSLAMPDIHWGYGFPVGGVAAFDADEGIISPGGVGYDLNCLHGSSRVLHEFGYYRRIDEVMPEARVLCADSEALRGTPVVATLRKELFPNAQIFKLTTETGREILATADHPFLTPRGMVPVNGLPVSEDVSIYSFGGVPYEEPSNELLVDEEDVVRCYRGNKNGLRQILAFLKDRGLLPVRMNHPSLPYLVKLMGFVQGDGSLSLSKGAIPVSFYGRPPDLQSIQRDIRALGFLPSKIRTRHRKHTIHTHYRTVQFERTESSVHSSAGALAVLLHALGTPAGSKTVQDFEAPRWLADAPLWIKRLYLAALFGAELSSPSTVTGHPYNFLGPVLSVNKRPGYVESGRAFLRQIQSWLSEFGIQSKLIRERQERVNQRGDISARLRLMISSDPENLIRLWSQIGYEYNQRKHHLGCVATQYLRLKLAALQKRRLGRELARSASEEDASIEQIHAFVGSPYVSLAFLQHAVWGPPRTEVRIGSSFPRFRDFLKSRTEGLGETGQVWETLIAKQPVTHGGPVFDLTVADENHNFVANSFVVSNCGVRLIRTNLAEEDVRTHLEPLVERLFTAVPSGVGSTGQIKVSIPEMARVMERGARWAVQNGYGWQEDLDVIEAGGALEWADPDNVSDSAKKRGKGQIGTLGSGNHFLEVQVLDEIFDAAAARTMGLEDIGQVLIFIHTGSRGLGHQVCTDFLKVAERSAREHGITLADRQLACMPFRSPEGQQYFGAMAAAANFAWANRQLITHWAREAFSQVFRQSPEALGMSLVYDVSHNIAKLEEYEVDGVRQQLIVHRKGATRAFPAGHPEVPQKYRAIGQPVLVPGDMGRYSYVAVGTEGAMRESFGSTCHGAGRVMGRKAATRALAGTDVAAELRKKGIIVRAQDRSLLAEEAPQAYKDVADVIGVCHHAGLSKRVARTRPIGVVKG
jgi:tRNA-splicing ligase RtcB